MQILITNDDGVSAPGLRELFSALQHLGKPVIIAPEQDNSAVSHALTMSRPLKVNRMEENIYSINGTPTDCVTIGINKVLAEKPALVVSGINPGGNLGDDVSYSGTVSAAVEGTMLGVHSMAVSLAGDKPFHYEVAARVAAKLAAMILDRGLPRDTLLNVNVPNLARPDIKGMRFTRQGRRTYDNAIKETHDPWGKQHFWIGGGTPVWDNNDLQTDSSAIFEGFISITPIHLDLTNYEALDHLRREWDVQLPEEP